MHAGWSFTTFQLITIAPALNVVHAGSLWQDVSFTQVPLKSAQCCLRLRYRVWLTYKQTEGDSSTVPSRFHRGGQTMTLHPLVFVGLFLAEQKTGTRIKTHDNNVRTNRPLPYCVRWKMDTCTSKWIRRKGRRRGGLKTVEGREEERRFEDSGVEVGGVTRNTRLRPRAHTETPLFSTVDRA